MKKMFSKIWMSIMVLVVSMMLGGCQSNLPAEEEILELRIALLVDDGNPQSVAVFEDFRSKLEAHLNIPVRIIEGATHIVGIEAMRAGNLDVMWGSPFVYLLARNTMDVERLVVTDNPTSVNKTVFITSRADIQHLEDLRGRTFAFISRSSTSGFFYPMYHLMNAFNLTRDQVELGDFFKAVTYSGSQNASVMGVIRGDFDAAAVGNLNLQGLIDSGVIQANDVRIIDSTTLIPFPGYIASLRLPAGLRAQIRDFLLAYDNEEYFKVRFGTPETRFVLPNEEHIVHLLSMSETLEIDLTGR